MIKRLLTFLLLLFALQSAFSQNRLITGTIMGDSMPLPGVSVNVKGTSMEQPLRSMESIL